MRMAGTWSGLVMEPIDNSALSEAVRTGKANGWTAQVGAVYTEFRRPREGAVEIVRVVCDDRDRVTGASWSPTLTAGDDRRNAPPRGKRQWVLDRLKGKPLQP